MSPIRAADPILTNVSGPNDDSGPNLGVRGAGFVLIVVGLLSIRTGYRIHSRTSRWTAPQTTAVYLVGALMLVGTGAIVFGAFLVTAGL
jgi:hypothetical protein